MTANHHAQIIIEKSALRRSLLSKRLSLADSDRSEWDTQIFNHLLTAPFFQHATKIGYYISHLHEPQLFSQVLTYLATQEKLNSTLTTTPKNKLFYLPILQKSEHKSIPPSALKNTHLVFGPCTKNTQYKNNRYDIPEPNVPNDLILTAPELDLILMPLVGFTANKNNHKKRLGMGGGFYDRTLAVKQLNPHAKPYLVGIAYDCQKVEDIPTENHDIDLDNIITENQIY